MTISAPHVLIAAGSRPTIPPIAGLVETGFHTSDSIMRLADLPKRLGIIGGGFIAAEMGHVFSSLGSHVTMVARSTGLLRAFDDEIAQRFTDVFGEPCRPPPRAGADGGAQRGRWHRDRGRRRRRSSSTNCSWRPGASRTAICVDADAGGI